MTLLGKYREGSITHTLLFPFNSIANIKVFCEDLHDSMKVIFYVLK